MRKNISNICLSLGKTEGPHVKAHIHEDIPKGGDPPVGEVPQLLLSRFEEAMIPYHRLFCSYQLFDSRRWFRSHFMAQSRKQNGIQKRIKFVHFRKRPRDPPGYPPRSPRVPEGSPRVSKPPPATPGVNPPLGFLEFPNSCRIPNILHGIP